MCKNDTKCTILLIHTPPTPTPLTHTIKGLYTQIRTKQNYQPFST